jgi:acyl-CoA thioester hydrolase
MDLSGLPLTLQTVIPETYLDVMGHMNVMWYTHLFGKATGELFKLFGLDRDYLRECQAGTFALQQLFCYLIEVRAGEEITIRSRVLGRSAKRLHVMHFMTKGKPEVLAARAEFLGTHVDMTTRRSSPFPPRIADPLDRLIANHALLGWDAPACCAFKT